MSEFWIEFQGEWESYAFNLFRMFGVEGAEVDGDRVNGYVDARNARAMRWTLDTSDRVRAFGIELNEGER